MIDAAVTEIGQLTDVALKEAELESLIMERASTTAWCISPRARVRHSALARGGTVHRGGGADHGHCHHGDGVPSGPAQSDRDQKYIVRRGATAPPSVRAAL
jgi:hypothetical protein